MVQLKGSQLSETEGKLKFHPRLTLMEHMFTSLKVHNLKVCMCETYSIPFVSHIIKPTLVNLFI